MGKDEFKSKKEEFIFYVEKAKQFLNIDPIKAEFYRNKATEIKKQIDMEKEKEKTKSN